MKIFLDDCRHPEDDTWVVVKKVESCIDLLQSNCVTQLSLDHDLCYEKTGYDVLLWIESYMVDDRNYICVVPDIIYIHTANTSAKKKMILACEKIKQLAEKNGTKFEFFTKWLGV